MEATDPVCTSTPDYDSDTIDIVVTDSAGGDTGICGVELIDATNLELAGLAFDPGDPLVAFSAGLIGGGMSGYGKLVVTDCH